ncbi:hypothetical protein BK809_0000381 [Diplodia seriata]|uniref:Diels-Alderase N-terminal domain-containing protein n=1 Tax=Diplodia seriata TaxID=420778 RepID=A0A1S8BAC7_9PEZI|nr:hypothetical protein BK809_0000381 [Diplodia seriata]
MRLAALAVTGGVSMATCCSNNTRTLNLAPAYHNGTVHVEHLPTPGNLDGVRMLTPAARSSADFWYFDVFSASINQTVNIVLFNSCEFSQYLHPLTVQVSGVYANGTAFYHEAIADAGVSLTNSAAGITGAWKGVGSFRGTSLAQLDVEYTITLDSAAMDISGTINLKSLAPPHHPCAPNAAVSADQSPVPGLFWAAAVPDAQTTVALRARLRRRTASGTTTRTGASGPPRYWGATASCGTACWTMRGAREHRKAFVCEDGRVRDRLWGEKKVVVGQRGRRAAWSLATGLVGAEGCGWIIRWRVAGWWRWRCGRRLL